MFFPGSAGYDSSIASYFSPQAAAVRPACYVTPQTTQEVSAVVKALTSSANGGPYDFAVRAGGHTWFAGANSSAGGVTIDLVSPWSLLSPLFGMSESHEVPQRGFLLLSLSLPTPASSRNAE